MREVHAPLREDAAPDEVASSQLPSLKAFPYPQLLRAPCLRRAGAGPGRARPGGVREPGLGCACRAVQVRVSQSE
eukprot:7265969-Alexandrium_andersonii.AAC.1